MLADGWSIGPSICHIVDICFNKPAPAPEKPTLAHLHATGSVVFTSLFFSYLFFFKKKKNEINFGNAEKRAEQCSQPVCFPNLPSNIIRREIIIQTLFELSHCDVW